MTALRTRTWTLGLALAALTVGAGPAFPGITVALQPAAQTVAPGSEFDVFIEVTDGVSAFNAFDTKVSFDPAALQPVPLSPTSDQIGSLMSAACANLFHDFRTGTSEDTVGVSLLCDGVSTTGPGTVYHLRFLASNTPQSTVIHVRTIRFFDAGLRVLPVTATDAQVGIGVAAGVGDGPGGSGRLELRAWPQPAIGSVNFSLHAPSGGARLRIFDLNGRLIRDLSSSLRGSTEAVARWDARDEAGRRVQGGLYFARAESEGWIVNRRVVIAH